MENIGLILFVFAVAAVAIPILLKLPKWTDSKLPEPKEVAEPLFETIHAIKKKKPTEATKTGYERLSNQTRYEHTLVLGGTGHGKTSLLGKQIADDLTHPCSVVVFDSQGDLVHKIMKAEFPRERVVIIDPTDIQYPLSLGLFDFNTEAPTPFLREQRTNTAIELLTFVLNSLLSSELTSKQDVLLRYVIRLCMVVPDSNLKTMRDIFTKGGLAEYQEYIDQLTESAQQFFLHEFDSAEFRQTKSQIQRRIYTILENPTLEKMFSSTETKLNMSKILDEGSLVLVNTAKSYLKEEGSAFFSRFIVALIYQAIQTRDLTKPMMPTFVYIDEAAPIIDENIGTMLETARKYNVGLVLSFQYFNQIPTYLENSVITNTTTKYLGGISGRDATTLKSSVGQIPHTPKMHFYRACKHEPPLTFKVEWGELDKLPKRTDLKELIRENRERYSVKEKKVTHSTSDDDFDAFNVS